MSEGPTRDDFAYAMELSVRYAETDMQGVVYFANYLMYYDTALTEYLRWLGWDYTSYVRRSGNDFHIVKSSVEYFASATFDDRLEIGVRTGRLGNSSIAFDSAIFANGRRDAPINRGEIVWVNTDQKTVKSAPLDPDLVALVNEKDPVRG